MMMTFKRTSGFDLAFQKLVVELDKELWMRYPEIQQNFAPLNVVDESFRVIVVKEAERLVGCGCFRPMKEKGVVEIKRMYVIPAFRGKGVGKMIVQELEQWATEEGFFQAKLETGINQPEAIAAYEKSGYTKIPNYGAYAHIEESICMMKIFRKSSDE